MEILTNCELTEHVGLIHDDEMKKKKNYAMFVEVNSTKSSLWKQGNSQQVVSQQVIAK